MPRGKKRDKPGADPVPEDPPVRKSSRKRKKKSFGESFEEVWSPPRGNGGEQEPTPGTSADPPAPPPGPTDTITWPSEEEYWKEQLPPNHSKRSQFPRKGPGLVRQGPSSAARGRWIVGIWVGCDKLVREL